jgi:hypothetical protein
MIMIPKPPGRGPLFGGRSMIIFGKIGRAMAKPRGNEDSGDKSRRPSLDGDDSIESDTPK